MKKTALIIVILCMLSACQDKNVRVVTNLDGINTANSKSYKGGNIVDDPINPSNIVDDSIGYAG